jgi:hypothetical protein
MAVHARVVSRLSMPAIEGARVLAMKAAAARSA